MQVNNNVSFGSIYRTVVPVKEFSQAGRDVVKKVIMPFAKKMSDDVQIFVGGPKFVSFIKDVNQNEIGNTYSYLKATKKQIPDYFSVDAPQPLYIVTGKKDISKIGDFLELRKSEDQVVRKKFGRFGEFMENTAAFERKFGNEIQNIDFIGYIWRLLG